MKLRESISSIFPIKADNAIEAVQAPAEHEVTVFSPVLAIIDSLSRKSGCFSKATQKLITDCSELSTEVQDTLRGKYAIALTLCELSAAGLTGPAQCTGTQSEMDTERCILALESKPQW